MNRILILFCLAGGFCIGQNFNAGSIIGINTSQVSGDQLSGFNKLGIRAGGFINAKLKRFDAQIELQYINKGSREFINQNTYNTGYRFHLKYVEIPFSAKKNLYNNIDAELGGSVGYLLNWIEQYDGLDDYGIKVNKIEYSTHIGLEYQINEHLYFNIRLSNSIRPIRPHTANHSYRWHKGQYNTSISFVIYYYFIKTLYPEN